MTRQEWLDMFKESPRGIYLNKGKLALTRNPDLVNMIESGEVELKRHYYSITHQSRSVHLREV